MIFTKFLGRILDLRKKRTESGNTLENLIANLKSNCFMTQQRTEAAFRNVPRHMFVDKDFADHAYDNKPLGTRGYQTISQPAVVARMTEWLELDETQSVLEVGAGSGWQAAIMAFLIKNGKVYTMESIPELVELARKNLSWAGIKNVEVVHGDGRLGLPDKASFDRIMVTAACRTIPQPLIDQLSVDGMLIAPRGQFLQSIVVLKKTEHETKTVRKQFGYSFVPLT